MNRRDFLGGFAGIAGAAVVGQAGVRDRAKPPHTDFDYADVYGTYIASRGQSPKPADASSNLRYQVMPYLDGRVMTRVQRANAVDGWLDVLTGCGATERVYGSVQILWSTPERRAEFAKAAGDRA